MELGDDLKSWMKIEYGDRYDFVLGGIYDFPQSVYPQVLKKYKKSCTAKKKSYLFLTLSPDKFLRNMECTPSNIEALKSWCKLWFHHNPTMYNGVVWCIENGSQGDHLHVHAVCDMKCSYKQAEKLKKSWAKHFPNNQLLTSVDCNSKKCKLYGQRGEYAYMRFDDPLILADKLEYFENEKKGSHENLTDLGVRGSWGVLTDNI